MIGLAPTRGRQPDAQQKRSRLGAGPLLLSLALLAAAGALAFVALRGPAPPGSMAERVRAVAGTLRCPVCQNLTVADSPSRLAQEMRRTIARDLRTGQTGDEIRDEFARAYGQWILESPPKSGIDLVAWIAPALLVLGGLAAAAWAVWRWSGRAIAAREGAVAAPAAEAPLSAADRSLLERALAGPIEEPE